MSHSIIFFNALCFLDGAELFQSIAHLDWSELFTGKRYLIWHLAIVILTVASHKVYDAAVILVLVLLAVTYIFALDI